MTKEVGMAEKFLRIEEVADRIGLSARTIRNKLSSGEAGCLPPSRKIPGSRLRVWRESDVNKFIASVFDDA